MNCMLLKDSYDSLGDSIPTTDLSMDANGVNDSMYPQRIQHKAPYAIPPRIPTDDPFISPVSNQVVMIYSYIDKRYSAYSFLYHDEILCNYTNVPFFHAFTMFKSGII